MNLHFSNTFFSLFPKTTKAYRKIMAIIVADFCSDFLYFFINALEFFNFTRTSSYSYEIIVPIMAMKIYFEDSVRLVLDVNTNFCCCFFTIFVF